MNICDVITRHAELRPDAPALLDGTRTIGYRHLDRLVRQIAAHLVSLGVRPGDRVGICLKDTADHFAVILAVARMGATVLPLDWRAREPELDRLVRRFAPRLVLVEESGSRPTDAVTAPLDDAWHEAVAGAAAGAAFPSDGDADFVIALSSGTTGEPRGTLITHAEYRARMDRLARNYGLGTETRHVSVTPVYFSGGRNNGLHVLLSGGTLIPYPTLFSPEEYVEQVRKHDATYAFLVPTVLRWLLDLPDRGEPLMPSFKVLVTGGASISAEEKRAVMRRISPNFHVSYSSSATGQVTLLKPHEIETHAETVGRANPLVEVEIVDDNGRPLPSGETGRLRCRGAGIGGRFYGEPAAADGWIFTGELAAKDADGYVTLKGRTSEIIIRDGINIYPDEIEQLLRAQPGVAEAAVVASPSPAHGEEAVAFVAGEGPLDPRTLLIACRRGLVAYKVPSEIVVVDELPKTTGGKVKKAELAAQL